MQIRIAVPLMLLLAGCAAPTDPKSAEAQPQNCVREYRVGSNIAVTNCAAPQTEAERQRMLIEIRNLPKPSPTRAPGPGG